MTIDIDDLQATAIGFVQTIDQCLAKFGCTWDTGIEGMTRTGSRGKLKAFGMSQFTGEHVVVWAMEKLLTSDYEAAKRALQGIGQNILQHTEIPIGFLSEYKAGANGVKRTVDKGCMLQYLQREFDKQMRWVEVFSFTLQEKLQDSALPSSSPSSQPTLKP